MAPTPTVAPGGPPRLEPSFAPSLRCAVEVPDVAASAAQLAGIASLRIHHVNDGHVALGCPEEILPFLFLVDAHRRPSDGPGLIRLTIGVTSTADLGAAVTAAERHGARLVRALKSDRASEVHVQGPAGLEVGFLLRTCPADDGPYLDATARAFAPLRLVGSSVDVTGPMWLDHLTVVAGAGVGHIAVRGTTPSRDDTGILHRHDGRPAVLIARRTASATPARLAAIC